jgi:hypothetical protein
MSRQKVKKCSAHNCQEVQEQQKPIIHAARVAHHKGDMNSWRPGHLRFLVFLISDVIEAIRRKSLLRLTVYYYLQLQDVIFTDNIL